MVREEQQNPRAVLLSFGEYEKLVDAPDPQLDLLTAEFDELLAKMQTPAARAGAQGLFSMSTRALGDAAVAAAKKLD